MDSRLLFEVLAFNDVGVFVEFARAFLGVLNSLLLGVINWLFKYLVSSRPAYLLCRLNRFGERFSYVEVRFCIAIL